MPPPAVHIIYMCRFIRRRLVLEVFPSGMSTAVEWRGRKALTKTTAWYTAVDTRTWSARPLFAPSHYSAVNVARPLFSLALLAAGPVGTRCRRRMRRVHARRARGGGSKSAAFVFFFSLFFVFFFFVVLPFYFIFTSGRKACCGVAHS